MAQGFANLDLDLTVNLACELHLNDWNGQNKVETAFARPCPHHHLIVLISGMPLAPEGI